MVIAMLQRRDQTCSNGQVAFDDIKIFVCFTENYQSNKQGDKLELLEEDPIEERARTKEGWFPFAVLERTDGELFKDMDDLLGNAERELAVRTR